MMCVRVSVSNSKNCDFWLFPPHLPYKSSRTQLLSEIRVFKNFVNFTRKHMCWSLFVIKLQA